MRTKLSLLIMTVASFALAGASLAQTATQDINLSANVSSYCTIADITNPAALTAAIPVTEGVVDTTDITNTIASVACNSPADIVATSLSGGVTTGGAAPTGTTNVLNYTGVATFAGATSTIDTSATAGAAGSEAGNTATTANAATGNLVVTVTPAQPSLPLAPSAAYADTLQVTLTAQ
ncbi:MAG: hypothetical protein NW216_07870 [Hyphomicrobium sp.]|nr:hypothetical protein [Hyphomicrobium sp.]